MWSAQGDFCGKGNKMMTNDWAAFGWGEGCHVKKINGDKCLNRALARVEIAWGGTCRELVGYYEV